MFIFNVVGFLGKLGIVIIFLVKVIKNFVFIFGMIFWMVMVKFLGVFSNEGLLENEYWVFVI